MSLEWCSRIKSVFYKLDEQWCDPKVIEPTLSKAGFTHFEKVGKDDTTHYEVLASR